MGVLALAALLCAASCKKAEFTPPHVDAANGAPADGGKDVAADAPADSVPTNTCAPDAQSRAKAKAEACSCDRECQTGFCVDGVCCTSACGTTCKACNLPSSPGDCAFVPAGGKPTDAQTCAASKPATCGQDGTCDGKGGCRKYVKGTECKPGTCDGDTVKDILTCDGEGQCSQSIAHPCPPYGCDAANNRCATSCTIDADCADGQQCVANRCGKSGNGASCLAGSDCSSGFCVDGFCCNIACSGACVSCDQPGQVGHCTYVPAGLPDPGCVATDRTSCGQTGLCDGAGACTLYPANTLCGPSSCSGLLENTPRTCDGQGTCRDSRLVDCEPFLCTNGACQTSCDPKGTDVCAPGIVCAVSASSATTGSCGKRKNGQPCELDDDCDSGICADGVCCESQCDGPCQSCALPGSPGQCTNVAVGATDPHGTCVDRGTAACSTNGVCDGQGACQTYPAGTECGRQSCTGGSYTPPSTCNSAGQCVASRSRTCNPFICNGDACFSSCTTSSQCVTGNFCTSGSCGLKPLGAECGQAGECKSGYCAQGVCCDGACTDACMACNLSASAGVCTAVPDHSPDPQGKCPVTQASSCGTTGACLNGACANYDRGIKCRNAACATGASVTPTSTCDGFGDCLTPADQPCGTFACVAGACLSSCTLATEAQDCVAPNSCVNGSCGLKVNGAACTNANQCASGFCTEGVCCETACADAPTGGLCMTCKGTSTAPAGTCAAVDNGNADPKSRCVKSNAAGGNCSNDGTCDGKGACRPWSSVTGCRQESCVGSTHTLPATCDGKGTCPTADARSCGAYVCSATSPTCLNTCVTSSDCTGGLTCLQTSNTCGNKLAAGDPCVVSGDCGTGLVCSSEGVCCDKACAGGCQSCKLTGKAGVCSNIATGGAPRSTTPATCPAAGTGLCGNDGSCDGSGACEQRSSCAVNNTVCPSDTHTRYTNVGVCSTAGVCGPQTSNCPTGYLCISGGACATTCTPANASTNCDTANGYTCIAGSCAKRPNSTTCSAGKECVSGNCVDGYCCSAASCPTCQSCNVTSHEGACFNVAANNPDGTCVGSCPSSTQASGLCDGAGACKGTTSCGTGYVCSAGICATNCNSGADCATGYTCAADKTCKKATGQTCAAGTDCATGNCVDSICCSAASCTDCMSCNVSGHLGACYAVPADTPDGACALVCSGYQLAGPCDGSGACKPAAACANGFLCANATQCASSCTSSCAPGYYCAGATCQAQKANGLSCATSQECTSGHCVDSTCCGDASCSDCMSCNVSGHLGGCYAVLAGTADGACVATCPPGSNQVSGLCNGSGACNGASACPNGNLCGSGGHCATDCSSTSCATGYFCAGTTCTPLKADGQSCAADGECSNGHCISNGTSTICCSTTCTDVTCGSTALCNASGSGCQSHAEGSVCATGTAACTSDGHGTLSADSVCTSGTCQPQRTDCSTGYLCVGTACVTPGYCAVLGGCDTAASYACNPDTGNCEPSP